MTNEPIFFDTDCFSSFLWVQREALLTDLYSGRLCIPEAVYLELCNPAVRQLGKLTDSLEQTDQLDIVRIYPGTPEHTLYDSLTGHPPSKGQKLIGKGEASALVLAKFRGGIVASNNYRDVKVFIDNHSLSHLTTGMILAEAFGKSLINENDGNLIWKDLRKGGFRLPWATFSEYLNNYI